MKKKYKFVRVVVCEGEFDFDNIPNGDEDMCLFYDKKLSNDPFLNLGKNISYDSDYQDLSEPEYLEPFKELYGIQNFNIQCKFYELDDNGEKIKEYEV